MIALLFLFHIATVVAHPQVTLLPKNPGLYFEYIGNLSLQANRYTVITEINLQDITIDTHTTYAHILGIARTCEHDIQCETKTTILKGKYTSVIGILQQILNLTESIPPHQHDRETYNIDNGLNEKMKIIQELRQYAIDTPNSSMLIQWNLIEASIDSQIEACTAIIEVIKSCFDKRISPKLIPSNFFAELKNLINKQKPNEKFPNINIYSQDFKEVGNIEIFRNKGIITFKIEFLLYSPAEFQLYHIHPVLVPQGNEVSATIETINHFIALNSNKTQHGLLKSTENCFHRDQTTYCKQPLQLYTTATCESQILQDSTTIDLEIFSIKAKPQKHTQWTHLQETNEWLFSTPHTENIEVRCNHQPSIELSIHEFGILQTDPYCQVITSDRILPYHTVPRTKKAHFKSNLQLRMPNSTRMENLQNKITNIQIVLYTFVAIFLLLAMSYIIFLIYIKYSIHSAISTNSHHTYTELDTLDPNNTPPTNDTATQTELKPKHVSFDSSQKYQLTPSATLRLPELKPLPSFDELLQSCTSINSKSEADNIDESS